MVVVCLRSLAWQYSTKRRIDFSSNRCCSQHPALSVGDYACNVATWNPGLDSDAESGAD